MAAVIVNSPSISNKWATLSYDLVSCVALFNEFEEVLLLLCACKRYHLALTASNTVWKRIIQCRWSLDILLALNVTDFIDVADFKTNSTGLASTTSTATTTTTTATGSMDEDAKAESTQLVQILGSKRAKISQTRFSSSVASLLLMTKIRALWLMPTPCRAQPCNDWGIFQRRHYCCSSPCLAKRRLSMDRYTATDTKDAVKLADPTVPATTATLSTADSRPIRPSWEKARWHVIRERIMRTSAAKAEAVSVLSNMCLLDMPYWLSTVHEFFRSNLISGIYGSVVF